MAAQYLPGTPASRATALSLIAALHVGAALAIASLGGIAIVVEKAPLLVQLLRHRPEALLPTPTRTLSRPGLREPELKLPDPPPFDSLSMVAVVERPATAPTLAALVSPVPNPTASAAPEPPRADLAYLNNPAPAYPTTSRRAGEQGRVLLRVRVDASGRVEDVEIERTSGFPKLDEAALTAVRRWRFAPARLGERTIAGIALVPIHFSLG